MKNTNIKKEDLLNKVDEYWNSYLKVILNESNKLVECPRCGSLKNFRCNKKNK